MYATHIQLGDTEMIDQLMMSENRCEFKNVISTDLTPRLVVWTFIL